MIRFVVDMGVLSIVFHYYRRFCATSKNYQALAYSSQSRPPNWTLAKTLPRLGYA